MHYEINVSRKGRHYFATNERSFRDYEEAEAAFHDFEKRFPKSEDFEVKATIFRDGGEEVRFPKERRS